MRRALIRKVASLVIIISMLFPILVGAQTEEYCESQYRILFGNGVLTTETDWLASSLALQSLIGNEFHKVKVNYGIAQNPSDGFLLDLYQAYQQKVSEDPSLSWEVLFRVLLGATDMLTGGLIGYVTSIIATVGNDNSVQLANKFAQQYDYADIDLVLQVAEIKNLIFSQGRRVLLLGHSQGGLYANAAHRMVYADPGINRKSFAVTAVATPANFVAGDGRYATSAMDGVVNAVRQFVASNTLPSNVDNPFNTNDFSGHQFIKSYLRSDFPSPAIIEKNITDTLTQLERPDDTYDFEVALKYGPLPTAWYQDLGGDAGAYGALDTCYQRFYLVYAGTGYEDYVANIICGPRSWTLIDRNKDKLNPFDPSTSDKYNSITAQILQRLSPHLPSASNFTSATHAFLVGKSPFYVRSVSYLVEGTTYTSLDYDENMNLRRPFEDLSFNVTSSPTYYPQYPGANDVFQLKFLAPLRSELSGLPRSVAQIEESQGQLQMKICKSPS